MARDLRRRLGVATVLKVYADGTRLVEFENGRRMNIQFLTCHECKKDKPASNMTHGRCLDCAGQVYKSQRYDRLRRATPPWVDTKEINRLYDEAKRITLETGVPHHVDHIWPITHEAFCGLHVPWNLRVIPSQNNYSKRNQPPLDYLQQINDT